VFAAIKAGKPTPEMLAYQYLQTLPQMAQGDANKVWLLPSDFGDALKGFASTLGARGDDGVFRFEPSPVEENLQRPEDDSEEISDWFDMKTDPVVAKAVAEAEAVARKPVDPAVPGDPRGAAVGLPAPAPAQEGWMPTPAQEEPEQQ